jgi:hypothetical protein
MAKRMKSKIQPAELVFTFQLKGGKSYLDLSQCASLINRRFYRQGLNWAVSDFKFIFSEQPAAEAGVSVSVSRLPTTWVMSNAWEKGFRAWQRMNKEALEENESVKPKFLDFKIYMDNEHHDAGFVANLQPSTNSISWLGGSPDYAFGEWDSSKVVVPETTTATGAVTSYELIALGQNNPGVSGATGFNAKSLIEGYAASRALPDIVDPNTPDDANSYAENWQMAMFNEGTLQENVVLDDMTNENNQSPYPFENGEIPGAPGTFWTDTQYPGGANNGSGLTRHDSAYVTNTTVGGVTHLKGGQFPCGLIEINTGQLDSGILQVTLVPGSHRGYLAESMVDM